MTWDTSKPADSDFISLGDDVIREFKRDVENSLKEEGIFPGSDPENPVYKWTGKRGDTASRPASPSTGEIYFNTQTSSMEYWNGSSWIAYDLSGGNGTGSITENDLNSSVAGLGLIGGAGTPLRVNVDNSTIDINSDQVLVKANGITGTQLNPSVAGAGLSGGGGSSLSVNVDNSTIEINSDSIRLKDGAVSGNKFGVSFVSFSTRDTNSNFADNVDNSWIIGIRGEVDNTDGRTILYSTSQSGPHFNFGNVGLQTDKTFYGQAAVTGMSGSDDNVVFFNLGAWYISTPNSF